MDPCIGSNSPVRSKFQRPALGDTEDEYCRLTSVRAPLASDLEASVGRRRRTGGGRWDGGAARWCCQSHGQGWRVEPDERRRKATGGLKGSVGGQ
jgi:hypothetical protein